MKPMIIGKLLVTIVLLLPVPLRPCTTFCFQYEGNWVYGRNYDWVTENCLIVVNKRDVKKVALTEDNPAEWTSKYGSITFNQYGREFPLGGMNETGLVIECMWLEQTEYPHVDDRNGLPELQWIQYQLDNCATVKEVLATDKDVRISVGNSVPLHFLVCDAAGQAAAIEFLSGKMVVYTKDDLPITALTNNTYEYALRFITNFDGDESSNVFKAADYSLKRFVWAAQGVQQWNPKKEFVPDKYAFGVLDKVAIDQTMFSIVYDVGNRCIYFKSKSKSVLRFVFFDRFDFFCTTPVKIMDIRHGKQGNVCHFFYDYTYEANYELIKKSYSETKFLQNTPDSVIQFIARYPETFECSR